MTSTPRKSAESAKDKAVQDKPADDAAPTPQVTPNSGDDAAPTPSTVTYKHKTQGTETTLTKPHPIYERNDNWERQ